MENRVGVEVAEGITAREVQLVQGGPGAAIKDRESATGVAHHEALGHAFGGRHVDGHGAGLSAQGNAARQWVLVDPEGLAAVLVDGKGRVIPSDDVDDVAVDHDGLGDFGVHRGDPTLTATGDVDFDHLGVISADESTGAVQGGLRNDGAVNWARPHDAPVTSVEAAQDLVAAADDDDAEAIMEGRAAALTLGEGTTVFRLGRRQDDGEDTGPVGDGVCSPNDPVDLAGFWRRATQQRADPEGDPEGEPATQAHGPANAAPKRGRRRAVDVRGEAAHGVPAALVSPPALGPRVAKSSSARARSLLSGLSATRVSKRLRAFSLSPSLA